MPVEEFSSVLAFTFGKMPQSGLASASGISPVTLVTDYSGVAQLCQ
jgi:hypothetical protein